MKQFAVFGNPIKHSKSPIIHQAFAKQFEHDISYEAILAPEDSFNSAVADFVRAGGLGCNVTLPFKEQAFELADEVSERAKCAAAVNTLSFVNGKILADNTDGKGLVFDLERHLGTLKTKSVLLIGAGGAAKGVVLPLFQSGVSKIVVCNRTESKATHLADQFSQYGRIEAKSFSEINGDFDIIVNSTSSSVTGDKPDIPGSVFEAAMLAYDMFYQKGNTAFMDFALSFNSQIKVSDGLGMLVGQAAESYRIWNGELPDIEPVLADLKAKMEAN